MIKAVSIKEIEQVAYKLARQTLLYDEPIPGFETRFPNILESCIAVPFQRFERKSLYKTLPKKAAALFYLMIKNHPFQNGNKRIAMTTLLYFLYKNTKWLRVNDKKLYVFAVWLAESPAELKDDVLSAAERFINKYLIKL